MLDLLFSHPRLTELDKLPARLVRALRLWVVQTQQNVCPMESVAAVLGSLRSAAHLHLLLEEVAVAWPDPFAVAPPCCPRLSHDELLLADMVRLAVRGDRPGFDRLLAEMIPPDERERLFLSTSVLGRAVEG